MLMQKYLQELEIKLTIGDMERQSNKKFVSRLAHAGFQKDYHQK